MPLITAADVRLHYPQLVGTTVDPELTTLIGQVDALVANYLGFPLPDSGARTLEDVTYTVYGQPQISGNVRRMVLPIRPVVSITTVHADLDEAYTDATLIPSTDYVLDANRGEVWLKPNRTRSWYVNDGRANRIVCIAGWVTCPPDLRAILVSAVRHLWDRRRSAGVATQAAAGVSQTYTDADALLPQSVRDALAPYVLWRADVG